jgi:hypothetical protein
MPEQIVGDVSGGMLSPTATLDKTNPMENCLEQSGVDWCDICDKPYVQVSVFKKLFLFVIDAPA